MEWYRRLTRVEERFHMVLAVLVLARGEMLQGATLCERGKRIVQMRQMCPVAGDIIHGLHVVLFDIGTP
jgi:hypothetical protein